MERTSSSSRASTSAPVPLVPLGKKKSQRSRKAPPPPQTTTVQAAVQAPARGGEEMKEAKDPEEWRVTREDLVLRKTELGKSAATYAFGGVFSCAMYGTAEAKDFETGEAYTEYILRCQWGPTFETTRPWMVARRFREFVAVDAKLRQTTPDLAKHLPPLPTPYVFFPMSPHVIEQRQRGLETYLEVLITELPATLKSPQIDELLCVSDRIDAMRKAGLFNDD